MRFSSEQLAFAYFLCGSLFVLWNMRSRTFKLAVDVLQAQGRLWMFAVIIPVGVAFWPAGAIVYIVIWIRRLGKWM